MNSVDIKKFLFDILAINSENRFLQYIVARVRSDDYRGWHVSQHNRYGMEEVLIILKSIQQVAGDGCFAIPPGDWDREDNLDNEFESFGTILNNVNQQMGRGTINSLKKNFFPDLEGMKFLSISKQSVTIGGRSRRVRHGQLTQSAIEFVRAKRVIDRYKRFTDAVDVLLGSKISELAEIIHLSDYAGDRFDVYEFMFIFSDKSEVLDKIELLGSYRSLKRHERKKVITLLKQYAKPANFDGDKTVQRDFHNWKNQAQQILNLLKATVYFDVDRNECFRLKGGSTGFFRQPIIRRYAPKKTYFRFHQVQKQAEFELHHIVPISSARNKKEAKDIDHHKNLIYIHREKHKQISRNRNNKVVLTMDSKNINFSDFKHQESVDATNDKDALYTKETRKIAIVTNYNQNLLMSIFGYEK